MKLWMVEAVHTEKLVGVRHVLPVRFYEEHALPVSLEKEKGGTRPL